MNIKYARRKLSRRLKFRGLNISIETDRGELRHWYDPHSKISGTTKMKYPYGYIRRTEGADGDHVDCYVGSYENAPNVYIVDQMKAPNFTEFDEQKCFLGFKSLDAVKKAYLAHYNDDRFFGSVTKMNWEDFEKKVKKTFDRPAKIAALLEINFPAATPIIYNMLQKNSAATLEKKAFYREGFNDILERLGLKEESNDILERLGLKEESTLSKTLPWLAGGGAGLLGYGLLRKYSPSSHAGLRALQKLTKDKKFSVATEPGSKGTQRLRSAIFGAPTVNKGKDVGGVVLHHTPSPKRGMGDVNIGEGGLASAMHDKYMFDKIMREGVGAGPGLENALPKTELLRDALKRVGGDPAKLKQLYPEGMFIKAREGSMGRGIFESLEDKGVHNALQNPDRFIIQERMPLAQEFRVHTLEGKPFHTTYRWLPHSGLRKVWNQVMGGGGGAFVPAVGKQRSELEKFVEQATKHLRTESGKPLAEAGEAMHAAYDVAKLKDNTYRLIEANPVPGTLMNPVVSQKLQRQAMGRWSKPVAALGSAGLALPTGLATSEITGDLQ